MHDLDGEPTVEKEPAPPWLLSFGDVTALLITFFVMLFSMSTLQSEKWEAIVAKLNSSKQSAESQKKPVPTAINNIATVELPPALPLGYLGTLLEEKLVDDPVLSRAVLHRLEESIVVSLPTDLLFTPGSVEVTETAKEALFRVGGVIATLGNQVDIEGHAAPRDDTPGNYTSLWILSMARAIAVADELAASGYALNIVTLGLADSRFNHLDPKLPETRRLELARRVDIVIHPDQGALK